MLAYALAWFKTIENINVFYRFRPCQGMHKHEFAGQNTQHINIRKVGGIGSKTSFEDFNSMSRTRVCLRVLLSVFCEKGKILSGIMFVLVFPGNIYSG